MKRKLKYIISYTYNLLSLTVRPFVTSFRKFLFARNVDYWFLGTSYSVHVYISDGDYGCSLYFDRSYVIVGEYILAALMYTVVVSYHSVD
jgi:hypothetical protein